MRLLRIVSIRDIAKTAMNSVAAQMPSINTRVGEICMVKRVLKLKTKNGFKVLLVYGLLEDVAESCRPYTSATPLSG